MLIVELFKDQIHVEKANRNIRGLYIAILKLFLETLEEDMTITVIATGFEKEQTIANMGAAEIVNKAWDKKLGQIPTPTDNSNSSNDLDIPSFLRKNKGIGK